MSNVRQDMEQCGTWEENRSGGWAKGSKRRNGESINLLGLHVTEFLINLLRQWGYKMLHRTRTDMGGKEKWGMGEEE